MRTPSSKVGKKGMCKKGMDKKGAKGPAARLVDYTKERPI